MKRVYETLIIISKFYLKKVIIPQEVKNVVFRLIEENPHLKGGFYLVVGSSRGRRQYYNLINSIISTLRTELGPGTYRK